MSKTKEFLTPFVGTASYVKMNYQNPFVTYETFVLSDEGFKENTIKISNGTEEKMYQQNVEILR